MACFTVPLAVAGAAGVAKSALGEKAGSNPFVSRLGWLVKMMAGGSFLLAIEHIWHGEIIFAPPFLTAIKEGPEATRGMLHEMATRGSAMALLLGAVWVAMVLVGKGLEKIEAARSRAFVTTALMFLGAALMWSVDCVASTLAGNNIFDLTLDDALLGATIVGSGFAVYAVLAVCEKIKCQRARVD